MEVIYILDYYLTFWLLNTAAYTIIAIGSYRWLPFMETTEFYRATKMNLIMTASFALARLTFGLVGLTLYHTGYTDPIQTVITLGVTSLLLNTAFILTQGIYLNAEAKRAVKLPEDKQALLKQLIREMDGLRRAVVNA